MKNIILILILLTISVYSQTYEIPLTNAEITSALQRVNSSFIDADAHAYLNFTRSFTTNPSITKFINVVPKSTSMGDISFRTQETEQAGYDPNYILTWGYNIDRAKINQPAWVQQMESNYIDPSGNTISEWIVSFTDSLGNGYRPMQLNIYRNDITYHSSTWGFSADRFLFTNGYAGSATYYIDLSLTDGASANGKPAPNMLFHSSLNIYSDAPRDSSWLYQENTSLIRLDGLQRVALAPETGSTGVIIGNGVGNLRLTSSLSNGGLAVGGIMTLDASSLWIREDTTQTKRFMFTSNGLTAGANDGTGTGKIYAGSYYTGSTIGYLPSALGSLTGSGLYVAESSGGSPTRQLYYRTVTINGVTIQVLTTDVP